MNAIHRSVWNDSTQTCVAVSELARAHGGTGGGAASGVVVQASQRPGAGFALKALAAVSLLVCGTWAGAVPDASKVTSAGVTFNTVAASGAPGSPSAVGASLTITQTTPKAVINWPSFNIAAGETVEFVQPNAQAVALNRVTGTDASNIFGSLKANGQVFLINPNGILFGKDASVNVQGLVASTLDLTDADFQIRPYKFRGTGSQSVENAGSLSSAKGGFIALLGATVSNAGTITAKLGTVALAAGQGVTLDIVGDKLLSVTVDRGVLNALVENSGKIYADGGLVQLTTQAAGALLNTVVNNTGVVQAQTVENHGGVIRLLGDMQCGTVKVAGMLDASAPAGGNGGLVETSAANVTVAPQTTVTTRSDSVLDGKWVVTANDFTISKVSTVTPGSSMPDVDLSKALSRGNVTITASAGDIDIEGEVTFGGHKRPSLTLNAAHNINVGSAAQTGRLEATGADLVLTTGTLTAGGTLVITAADAATGAANVAPFRGRIDLSSSSQFTLNEQPYTVITDLRSATGGTPPNTLQGMSNALDGHFVLGADIKADAPAEWRNSDNFRFTPIGSYKVNPGSKTKLPTIDQDKAFTGVFDGLGHQISNLTVRSGGVLGTGLFGATGGQSLSNVGKDLPSDAKVALIQNVELLNPTVSGLSSVGALVGFNAGVINNSFVTGPTATVTGVNKTTDGIEWLGIKGTTNYANSVGGLVGQNIFNISHSFASATTSSTNNKVDVGGMPQLAGLVGGLVGFNAGSITQSSAAGAVTGYQSIGGLVGGNAGTVTNSFATGPVGAGSTGGGKQLGGLVGNNSGVITGTLVVGNSAIPSYATGIVMGTDDVGGLVGRNSGRIALSYATGSVSGHTNVGGLVGINQSPGATGQFGLCAKSGEDNCGNKSQTTDNAKLAQGFAGSAGVDATITASYATGTVSGMYAGNSAIGGLVGWNAGGDGGKGSDGCDNCATGGNGGIGGAALISQSYASGVVTGALDVGGLVGRNSSGVKGPDGAKSQNPTSNTGAAGAGGSPGGRAAITDSYASGAVSGDGSGGHDSHGGGLIGRNSNRSASDDASASVTTSYSSGAVSGFSTNSGKAIGLDEGGVYSKSYYLSQDASPANGRAAVSGLTGLSTDQFAKFESFAGFGFEKTDPAIVWGKPGMSTLSPSAPFLCALTLGCAVDVRVQVVVPNTAGIAAAAATAATSTSTAAAAAVDKPEPYLFGGQSSTYGNVLPGFTYRLVTPDGVPFVLPAGFRLESSTSVYQAALVLPVVKPANATPTVPATPLVPLGASARTDASAPASTTAAGHYIVGYTPDSLTVSGSGQSGDLLAKSYSLAPYLTDMTWTVLRAPVIVSAPTVTNSIYGSGTVATLTTTGTLKGNGAFGLPGTGILAADVSAVMLKQVGTGTFSSRNVGSGIAVSYFDSLSGAAAGNYQLSMEPAFGTITVAPLTVTGVVVTPKTYDGTTAATVTPGQLAPGPGSPIKSVTGVLASDASNVKFATVRTGNFNCADAGAACSTVTVLHTLTGTAASNYALTDPTGPTGHAEPFTSNLIATISPAPLTISGLEVATRVYDGTRTASLSGTATLVGAKANTMRGGIFAGDVGQVRLLDAPTSNGFALASASASAQAVTLNASLTGPAAANYVLVAPALTGYIKPAALQVVGSVAVDKTYDGTLDARLTGGSLQAGPGNLIGSLNGVFGSDVVTLLQTGTFASANASSAATGTAAAQTVTPTESLSGAAAPNYVLTPSASLMATITPAPLTVAGTTVVTRNYNGATAAVLRGGVLAPASGNTIGGNGVFADDLANVQLNPATSGSFAAASAGLQAVTAPMSLTLSDAAVGNYVLVAPQLSGYIKPAPLTLSGLSVANKTYDGSAAAVVTGTAVLVAGVGNTLGSNVNGSSTGILSADMAGVKLNASNLASFASPNASASAQVVSTAATLTLSGSATANYVLVQPAGLSGFIKPAALAVIGSTVADKTFDGSTAATPSGGVLVAGVGNAIGTASGVFGSDAVTLVQAGRFSSVNAASQPQRVISADQLSGASAGNYVLTPPTGWTATISPAPLTVSGTTVATRSYDGSSTVRVSGGVLAAAWGNTIGAAVGANGVLSSDAANVTLVTATSGQIASPNASAATQAVSVVDRLTLSGAAAGNYTLVQPELAGLITPAPLTAAGTTVLTRSYDASAAASVRGGALAPAAGNTMGGSGVAPGDAAGVVFTPATSGSFASVNASAIPQLVTVTDALTLTGTAVGNYVLVQPTVLGTITPAPLTVSGSSVATRTYDGSSVAHLSGGSLVPAPGNTLGGSTGVYAADAANLTLQLATTGNFASVNASAAAQPVSVANLLVGTAASNYLLVQPDLSGVIMPAPLTVTGTTVAARTYDGSRVVQLSGGALAPANGNTIGGVLASDAAFVRLVLATIGSLAAPDASANARSVSASDSLVLSGPASGNYVLIQPTLAGLISQAPITVVGTRVLDKTFNGNTLASLVDGQFAPVNTGSAATRNTVAGSGVVASDLANLQLNQSGAFITSQAYANTPLLVIAHDSLSGAAAGNYVLVQPTGLTGALLPAPLTLANIVVSAKTYDGSNVANVSAGTLVAAPGNTIGGSGVLSADVGGVVLIGTTTGRFASANASPDAQAVSVADRLQFTGNTAGNYVLVMPALTGTISPAPLTVSGTLIAARTYDGTGVASASGGTLVPVLTGASGSRNTIATASGVLAADAAQVVLVQAANFASPNASSAAQLVTTSDALVLSGSAVGNYVLVQPTGLSAVISPAPLTLSGATALNKTYDGTANALLSGGSLVAAPGSHGVVSADAAQLTLTQVGVFASANANPAAQVVTANATLSGAAAANYTMVQPTGLRAVIAPAPLSVVGASVLARSYDGSDAASLVGATLAPAPGNSFGGNGVLSADAAGVSLLTAGRATFASPNAAASAQAVSVNAALALTGSAAGSGSSGGSVGNYVLVQPTGLVGVISPAALTVVGASVVSKVFDATPLAVLVGASLAPVTTGTTPNLIHTSTGVLGRDAANVLLTAAGSFATPNASAAAQAVSVQGNLTLSGPAAGNYVLIQPADLSGTIRPATLTVTATANQKTYDGSTAALATPVVSGLVAGSTLSGLSQSYDSANVLGALGSTLRVNRGAVGGLVVNDGNNGANYTVVTNSAVGTITPAALSVIDTLVGNKVYDASTATTVSGGVLVGLFNHDAVTLVQSGAFLSANVGQGVKAATVDALAGSGAGNYVVPTAVTRFGNILAAPLTVSGTLVADKVFDTSNAASLSAGSLVGVVASDLANVTLSQSGAFVRPVPDSSIPVTTASSLGGTAAANYVLIEPLGLVANISPNPQMPTVASLSASASASPSLVPASPLALPGSTPPSRAADRAVAEAATSVGLPAGGMAPLAGLNLLVVDQGIRLPLANVAQP